MTDRQPPTPTSAAEQGRPAAAVVAVRRIFAAETGNYFLLLGTTLFLVVVGLVMVLSSSSVESFVGSNDFFGAFARQGLFAVVGIPLMLIASRMPVSFWKRWAWQAVVATMALQLLVFVPGIGIEAGGNRNWISLGGFSMQPSEAVKVALVMWLAMILTTREGALTDWRRTLTPIAPVAGLAILLVLLGNDLGTVLIMFGLVMGALFFAGVRLRYLVTTVIALAAVGAFAIQASSSRVLRIEVWLDGCAPEHYANLCWQYQHGLYALAAGGLFGQGLGNSKAKWSWLPEADNDFIFAIIGEELGLVGATVVLLLFVVLTIAFVRIVRATRDPYARVATAAVMAWIVTQAFVNIAVVLGLLPVLGVPLPLISAGGSSLVTTLFAIGIVLSFARHRPDPAPGVPAPAGRPGVRSIR